MEFLTDGEEEMILRAVHLQVEYWKGEGRVMAWVQEEQIKAWSALEKKLLRMQEQGE